jgi:hypothetical protein
LDRTRPAQFLKSSLFTRSLHHQIGSRQRQCGGCPRRVAEPGTSRRLLVLERFVCDASFIGGPPFLTWLV